MIVYTVLRSLSSGVCSAPLCFCSGHFVSGTSNTGKGSKSRQKVSLGSNWQRQLSNFGTISGRQARAAYARTALRMLLLLCKSAPSGSVCTPPPPPNPFPCQPGAQQCLSEKNAKYQSIKTSSSYLVPGATDAVLSRREKHPNKTPLSSPLLQPPPVQMYSYK